MEKKHLFMKSFNRMYTFPALSLLMLLSLSIDTVAQVNRRDTKKSVPYRANYQRMSSGCSTTHTLEIKEGALWAWGNNSNGQLGDNTLVQKTAAVHIGSEVNWVTISTGALHSLGIQANGTLWAWGDNTNGQLGDNTWQPKKVPTKIGEDDTWISVVAGNSHNLGLKSDGTLWTWGNNSNGQLGDNTTVSKNVPTQIGDDDDWTTIMAGDAHSLALKSDGTLWAWGKNTNGQLGTNSTAQKNIPTKIGTDDDWVKLSAGGDNTHCLKSDGTLWGWGNNSNGQLGDATLVQKTYPIKIGSGETWVSIASGMDHTIALKANGTLWVWGNNNNGQLGDATIVNQSAPIQIGIDVKWVSVGAGSYHSFGLKSDGTLWAWGNNSNGQLGNATVIGQTSPIQVSADASPYMTLSIVSTGTHSAGLRSDGTMWTWGEIDYGSGNVLNTQKTPVQIGGDNKWISVVVGYYHNLALKSDGTLWVWGENAWGQFGDGQLYNVNYVPTQVGTDHDWVSIAAGTQFSLALKADGTLWSWGANTQGELGIGGGVGAQKLIPTQVGTSHEWVSISAYGANAYAIKSNGTLRAWGDNYNGQVGIGTTIDANAPTQVGSSKEWVSVSAGEQFCLGLRADGTLRSWGNNTDGQLGDGTLNSIWYPNLIGNSKKWIMISAGGGYHSLGIKSNGTLYAWGDNYSWQLGDGGYIDMWYPSLIGSDNNWVGISEGGLFGIGFTLALKADRNQYCAAGENYLAELGNNSSIDIHTITCITNGGNTLREGISETSESASNQSLLNIYPNPNNGVFTIQAISDGEYSIINKYGQIVQYLHLNSDNNFTVNVDNLNKGLYFIVGYSNGQKVNQKIVVTK